MNELKILDKGFVRLVDHMGDDSSIVQAARVSYGEGTKHVSKDSALIRYLMRHKHTSPIEMVEFKFHMKMPMFVARQIIRHRTTSVNEYSARYSILSNEFYIPEAENIKEQSDSNNQGRQGEISKEDVEILKQLIKNNAYISYETYEILLGKFNKEYDLSDDFNGISRELARMVLPINTYTEWYWKINLHNLLHFLKLRMDKHTQWETQQYANAIYHLIKPIVPITCEAFEDYVMYGKEFSKGELDFLGHLLNEFKVEQHLLNASKELEKIYKTKYNLSNRELYEFKEKLKEIIPW